MMHQPNDIPHYTFDENKFSTLGTELSLRDDSSISVSKPQRNLSEYSPSKLDESFDVSIVDEFISGTDNSCTTPVLAPVYHPHEQPFLGDPFDDSDLVDPLKAPINEITVNTTSSVDDLLNSISSDFNLNENLTCNDIETRMWQFWLSISLQAVDDSIQQRTMSVARQPPTNLRPRYKSDGTRQIEKSRTKPMVVTLPDLKDIKLEADGKFLLRLSLIKYNADPSTQKYLHVNRLEYHSDEVQEMNDETVCVPLTLDDISEGEKALPRLSIVKTKLEAYKSALVPYYLTGNDNQAPSSINNGENVTVKKAKTIFKQNNMKASRIACQLLIEQNDTIHYTNITCETDAIIENQNNTPKKRSASADDSEEEESTHERPSKSRSTKRKKPSHS